MADITPLASIVILLFPQAGLIVYKPAGYLFTPLESAKANSFISGQPSVPLWFGATYTVSGKTVSVQSLVPTVVIGVPVNALGQLISKSQPVLPHSPTISTSTEVKLLLIFGITKVQKFGLVAVDKETSVPAPETTPVLESGKAGNPD